MGCTTPGTRRRASRIFLAALTGRGFVAARLCGCAASWLLLAATTPAAAQRAVEASAQAEERTARYFDALGGDPSLTLMFLREMPKGGELHTHLSGAMYAETMLEWAAADGLCFDMETLSFVRQTCDAGAGRPSASGALADFDLRALVIDAMSMRNWNPARDRSGHHQFFGSFERFRLAVRGNRTADMLAELADRAAANRVSYVEVMVTPSGGVAAALGRSVGWDRDLARMRERLLGAGLRDSVAAASRTLAGFFAGQRELLRCGTPQARPGCDIEVRVLYQVLREQPPEQVFAQILAAFELTMLDPRMVGLNLVQPEDGTISMRDYSLHMRMIESLRRVYPRVPVTLHAGELTRGLVPPEGLRFHIREAVRVAQANRIGHGVAIAYEDSAAATLRDMAQRRVLVEIALSSNDAILGVRGAEHPLALYMRHDIPVTLVTDDEGVLRSEMTLEYLKAVREHGLGYIALKTMARNSLEYSFVEGESYWRDYAARLPVAECASHATGTARPCEQLLARSAKARLQWQLERAFAAFEQAYARTP